MKISHIKICNFRSIRSLDLDFIDYNLFVGANGVGKSNILQAINLFFGEIDTVTESDFWQKDITQLIEVTLTFDALSKDAASDFDHYVRDGKLIVSLEIDGNFKRTVRGQRLAFEPFQSFFRLPASPAKGRTDAYNSLREKFQDLPAATTGEAREQALRQYESRLPEDQKTLLKSGDEFFGATKGIGFFKRHVAWVHVPAVKDASAESTESKSTHLGKLIQHTVRSIMNYQEALVQIRERAKAEYDALLDAQNEHLSELQTRLSARISESVTSHAGLALEWRKDEKMIKVEDPVALVQLIDRGFQGDVSKFGHGLQRTFLIALLQELVATSGGPMPTLILGIDEPELYQHPPQAKHLSATLQELSKSGSQVLLTTHSPYFVSFDALDGLKKVTSSGDGSRTNSLRIDDLMNDHDLHFSTPIQNEKKLATKLSFAIQPQYGEMFFCDRLVLVEGVSDVSYFSSYLRLSGRDKDFRKRGIHFVVADGKSNLILLLLIARSLGISVYSVFDCDANSKEKDKEKHKNDNLIAFRLLGRSEQEAFPDVDLIDTIFSAWVNNIEDFVDAQIGDHVEACKNAGATATGHSKDAEKKSLYVAGKMKKAFQLGCDFPGFRSVIDRILALE